MRPKSHRQLAAVTLRKLERCPIVHGSKREAHFVRTATDVFRPRKESIEWIRFHNEGLLKVGSIKSKLSSRIAPTNWTVAASEDNHWCLCLRPSDGWRKGSQYKSEGCQAPGKRIRECSYVFHLIYLSALVSVGALGSNLRCFHGSVYSAFTR